MADVVVNVKSDISGVEKDVIKLSRELRDAKLAFKELEKGTEEYAKKKSDIDNLTRSLNTSKDALQDLRSETKKTSEGFAEAKEKMGGLKDAAITLQGSGIERLKNSFGLFKEGLETADFEKAKTGFKGLGAAMKAIPVFLIVEGIMKLIESFDELKESGGIIGKVFSAIGDAIDWASDKLEEFGDWISGVDTDAKRFAENQIESAKAMQQAVGDRYDYEIKKANAAGKNTSILEINKVRAIRESINKQIELLEKLDGIKDGLNGKEEKQLAELKKSRDKSVQEETILRTKQYNDLVNSIIEANKKRKELDDKAADESKKRADNKLKNEQALADAEYDIWKANHEREKKEEEEAVEQSKKDFDEAWKEQTDKQDKEDKDAKDKKIEDDKKLTELKKQEEAARYEIAKQGVESAQMLSELFFDAQLKGAEGDERRQLEIKKRAFNVNKAFQASQAAIDGTRATLSAFATAPPGFKIAAAAAAGIFAAAQVAKILAARFNPGSAPSASSGGGIRDINTGGGVNPAAQPIPQRSQDSTQFDEAGNRVTKVVVLASDIKDVTRSVARVEEQARF